MAEQENKHEHEEHVAAAAAATTPSAASSSNGSTSTGSTFAETLYAVETLVQVYQFSPDAANQAVQEVGASDLKRCYHYILDQGLGKDTGGAVHPIANCPHVSTQVSTSTINNDPWIGPQIFEQSCQYHSLTKKDPTSSLPEKKTGMLKEDTTIDVSSEGGEELPLSSSCPKGENWLCLTCRKVFCSRYVNGHGLQHWKDTCGQSSSSASGEEDGGASGGHCVTVSLADLSVWCHVCGAYLVHDETILKPLVSQLEQCKFAD